MSSPVINKDHLPPLPKITPRPNKTLCLIILIVIGIVAVGACLFVVLKGRVEVPPAQEILKPKDVDLEESEEKPPFDATEDWQVYQNSELGFEIKYPKSWETELLYDFNLSIRKKGDGKFYELKSNDYLTFFYPDLRVSVGPTDETDIRKYEEKFCEELMTGIGACSSVIGETIIGGVRALKLLHCVESANRRGLSLIKNGYLYSITTPYLCIIDPTRQEYPPDEQAIIDQFKALEQQYAPIHNEILASFKFIN